MSRLVAAASLCFLMGCGLGDDDSMIGTPQVDSGPGIASSDGGPGAKLQKPSVEQPPGNVCGSTVPIQGTAVPGSSVFAVGGLEVSGIATDAHPVTGRFCLDVRLKADAANTVEVRAQDPVLGMSEPATVTVQQGGTCNDSEQIPVEQPKPQNVALGIKARASKSPAEGNEGFLTDGKTTTAVKYSGGWGIADANVWVTVKLDKLYEVGSVVVKWGSPYATKYKVLVSAMTSPGDPNLKNGYWTEVANFSEGNGGTDTIDLTKSKPVAQHVAVWMNQDNNTGWDETFKLTELEVWDIPKKVTAAPAPTNTCATLGN